MTHSITPLDPETRAADSRSVFGFWAYLMTDLVLFASLFAVFAVMRGNTFGGPGASEIADMPRALLETILLLSSSFSCGLMLLFARRARRGAVLALLAVTLALGALFVFSELTEFASLVAAGDGPSRSGFLSAYFTLVGTHGLHVSIGILWGLVLFGAIALRGLDRSTMRKIAYFGLFWHFLELVWIFIFTIVYLMSLV